MASRHVLIAIGCVYVLVYVGMHAMQYYGNLRVLDYVIIIIISIQKHIQLQVILFPIARAIMQCTCITLLLGSLFTP